LRHCGEHRRTNQDSERKKQCEFAH
jgi:hypothetical protein